MTEGYSFGFYPSTIAGVWFVLKKFTSLNRKSILTRAQLLQKLDMFLSQQYMCSLLHKIQVMDAQSWFSPQGFSHTLKLINYAHDLSIQKLRHLLARKQLETEMHMETTRYSFGGTYCLYTAIFDQLSPVQSTVRSKVKRTVLQIPQLDASKKSIDQNKLQLL